MEQLNSVSAAARNVAAYVVRCIDAGGRRFLVRGLFGSDWEAIDSALEQGAVFATPQRQGRGSPALRRPVAGIG